MAESKKMIDKPEYMRLEGELIALVTEYTEHDHRFIPDADWMIDNKTGRVPEGDIHRPNRLLNPAVEEGVITLPHFIFLSEKAMPAFEKYRKNPHRWFKIHNYGKPAVDISFYRQHRYEVKQMSAADAKSVLEHRLEEADPDDLEELGRLHKALKGVDKRIWYTSNYHRRYYYTSMSWQWLVKQSDGSMKHKGQSQHIAERKTNIVFLSDRLAQADGRSDNKAKPGNKKVDTLISDAISEDFGPVGLSTMYWCRKMKDWEEWGPTPKGAGAGDDQ